MKIAPKTLILLAVATLAAAQTALAGAHVWSGATSVYFSNPGNWSFGGAPTGGEADVSLVFPPGVTRYTCSNNISGLNVKSVSFTGHSYTLLGNAITMVGSGITNLSASGNQNAVAAPLVLGGSNMTVNVSSGYFLFLSGAISGSGGLTKTGAGTLRLSGQGDNSYSGTTYVNAGTLEMAKSPYHAISGPLVVGTPLGAPGTVFAKCLNSGQIANTHVTVNYTGEWDLSNNSEWIGGLTLDGGLVQTGTGKIALLGNVDVETGVSAINGNVWLYYSNRTVNVVPGGTLNINAVIDDVVGTAGIIKTGAGALNLHAANLFAGPVLVSQGYLGLYHNGAMGSSSGLTVTNLGIVQMFNVGITGIPATLSGNGNGNGCVRAFDTNFWTGPITLAGNAGIQPFAAKDVLILDTSITGNGNLTKLGAGKLSMTGSDGNNYQGRTFVNGGTLELGKSGARSIPGPLTIGDATNAANSRVVRLTAPNQIADTADVMINASGVLDLDVVNSISEAIGSLAGAGNVRVGANKLASGTNDATTTFSGSLASSQSGSFEKYGDGTMFLTGNSPGFAGSTFVKGGVLSVNGSLSAGTVYALANGTVAGDGVTGVLAAFDGKITPGDSPGLLQSGNFGMSQDAMLEVELDGTAAGVTYDQIAVTGFVNLGNANLRVLLGFSSAVSNRFVIIANDGNDVVVNTFKNLPEGAPFFIGTAQFQISYQGGDGNDVELTQVGVAAPPQIGLVKDPGNGQIQITGNGMAGAIYDIQANSDLNTTNWTKIGTVPADLNGLINFTDVDATNFMMRFYRLKGH